jgi:hypothetical protein
VRQKGRAQFVILRISNLETIAIYNAYMAKNFKEKTSTWKLFLKQNLEATGHYIMNKDFNNLEMPKRMGPTRPIFMLKRKVVMWHQMAFRFKVLDTW